MPVVEDSIIAYIVLGAVLPLELLYGYVYIALPTYVNGLVYPESEYKLYWIVFDPDFIVRFEALTLLLPAPIDMQ
jgi:hypothetical protein